MGFIKSINQGTSFGTKINFVLTVLVDFRNDNLDEMFTQDRFWRITKRFSEGS